MGNNQQYLGGQKMKIKLYIKERVILTSLGDIKTGPIKTVMHEAVVDIDNDIFKQGTIYKRLYDIVGFKRLDEMETGKNEPVLKK